MTEEIHITENKIYYYYNSKGNKNYTPNLEFAEIRANFYKTYDVYVEKYL